MSAMDFRRVEAHACGRMQVTVDIGQLLAIVRRMGFAAVAQFQPQTKQEQ